MEYIRSVSGVVSSLHPPEVGIMADRIDPIGIQPALINISVSSLYSQPSSKNPWKMAA